ncbi:MAG: hypothetical protein H6696_01690 [Deferribacteres bacterium]|nr:hypothetical protein [candidate division KSB1 bacterium]MCB9500623.1 hypothetical protein [Deferribacteres bacterium]
MHKKICYISWAENCSRSDHTARELGGVSHMIYLPKLGSKPSTIILKYIGQFVMSLRIIVREKPDAVFVMSPPIFAVLPAWFYKIFTGTPFVIDTHTAALMMPRWKHLQWLQHWLGRQAATTVVHNEHLAEIVRKNGAHASIIRDVPVQFPQGEKFALNGSFNIAAVCSFNYDEPIKELFEAAERLPEVRFYMTGNPRHLNPELKALKPENVTLTGFLSDAAYGDLVRNAHAVMTLTTRDHTMLRGAWEAIYQSTPVIISDWPILQENFPTGAVHVDNSVPGIVNGIKTLRENYEEHQNGANQLCDQKHTRWENTKQEILNRLK